MDINTSNWTYKIFEGFCHIKQVPMYQVVGVMPIADNWYCGEFHYCKETTQKELNQLA